MSINVPELVESTAPEQPAAVNEIPQATSLKAFSEAFYQQYEYLFTKPVGSVAQIDNPLNREGNIITPVETIVLDARGGDDGAYVWEITHGGDKFTKKWQLNASEAGISGTYTEFISNGALWRHVELSEAQLAEQEDYLRGRLADDDVAAAIATVWEDKIEQQERVDSAPNAAERAIAQALLERLGFVGLSPFKYDPNVIPAAFAPGT